ncbi:DNA polymerase III subunit delta [Coxiella endosymbiont of Amblyomma nuttalli]|uniref:DNA polymerase III subunit delta n=1 Tax=Coxiella endosymbiont of Amblyomma nuttalli TaxID=2749996 RepID=UPI001BA64622|nr:DNA polymerase III subunit delta [Coxiella endosymbiont of Amblyomma nuttalli]QTS83886.1 DNA polymerase III subunit delta [Coxiella endosymbiont of Amblyomma nuttalli]
MQLSYKQLNAHLNQNILLPVYLICGDIPLLVQESGDLIRKIAKKQGFQQRELLFVETDFHWQRFTDIADNFNLLSKKIIIEIRNAKAKFDEQATQTLLRYLNHPPNDKRLLIITNKLTVTQQKTRWYKAIEYYGAVISLWPLSTQELLVWITQRLKSANLNADAESITFLAELTEGNLLAIQQSIEKLRLFYHDKPITSTAISTIVSDNAYFTIFDLTEAALIGESSRVIRILWNLYCTNKELASLVLWTLTRELRVLYPLVYDYQRGKPLVQLLASQSQVRKQLFKIALPRLNTETIAQLLKQAKHIDHIIKGIIPGNAWQALESLSLVIAGQKLT